MKIDDLLTELRGNLPIAALNNFNKILEESNDAQGIIHGLLLASRRCEEILDLLMTEKRTSSELSAVFTTLSHVLLNIAGELKEFTHIGLHITLQLLHNSAAEIHKLLLPSNTNKTSKSVLRCLTGMVLIGGQAATEVLTALNWEQINISLIANRQSLKDVYDVRAWCIYLIMAFLNSSEDPFIIKQFLQKKDILPAVFPGLVWDPCERVINVLKVMLESVLLNPDITKTMKIAIFTPVTTKPLLDLYNWMGPVGKLAKGGSMEDMEKQLAEEIHKERAQVREVLQKFMLTLCSSIKHGIIFKEKAQEGRIKSNNWYIYKIVSHLKTPWESPEGCELMSSVLGACPDLLKTYIPSLKDYLTPRPTAAFASFVRMLAQIIDHQEPWNKLDTKGFTGAVACILPQPINYHYIQSLVGSYYRTVRHSGILLMLSILSKTKETNENIINNKGVSHEIKHHHHKKFTDLVFKVLKTADSVILCWKIASGQEAPGDKVENTIVETAEPAPQIIELLSIAKVLTLYVEMQPNQAIYETLNPLEMLHVVQKLETQSDSHSENFRAKLELQVLCLGFLADSKHSQEIVIDSTATEDEHYQHIEKTILYQLINTYAQSGRGVMESEDASLMLSVTEKCHRILTNSLSKVGLPTHYDGSIKFWLRHITCDKITKLSTFLTKVIHQTISSLTHYTDAIITLGSSSEHHNKEQINSFMTRLETVEVDDNEEVSTLSISLPFSRLILAAVDLLKTDTDSDYVGYFSSVITDYLYSLHNPELLAAVLLENENVITSTLVEYLRSWCRENTDRAQNIPKMKEYSSLSEILKYLFMTSDWSAVETLLEDDKLKNIISKRDLDLVISQLLLYLHLDLGTQKKGRKNKKKYVGILRQIFLLLEDDDPEQAEQVIQMVLEHPRMLTTYFPFCYKKTPANELAQDFIEFALQKHPTLASKTVPYFNHILKEIEIPLSKKDCVNYWGPVSPFITSYNTVVTFEATEQMLTLCLKAPVFYSESLENLVLELIKLLLKTTSAKRKLTAETVELLFLKFLELGRSAERPASWEIIVQHLEALLVQVLSDEAIGQLTSGDLKSLLRFDPPCVNFCCYLVKQQPQHGHTIAKYLKKHRTVLPAQAPLLALLLNQSNTLEVANAALAKVSDVIKMWVLDVEGQEDETSVLLPYVLRTGLLDESTLTDVCHNLYEEVITNKQQPPKKLLSLLLVFEKLSKTGPVLPRVGMPEECLAILHICLTAIKTSYQKENQNASLLLRLADLIRKIIPRINPSSLKSNLTSKKLWSSFVKQVLRNGMSDQHLGPDLVQTLNELCSIVYRRSNGSLENEGESVLPIGTLYQMINGHSQYLTLMFNREEEWERLKEKVVVLQQTLVDCDETVCQENHVPILLGAYGASMSRLDQHILKLLFTYERKGFMTTYQPVLWGEIAVTHFGVRTSNIGFFRDPMPEQIMGLLDMERLIHTCHTFNTRLPLEVTDVHREDRTVYDMRFLLPLMLHLAEEESLSEIDYAESGAVALGLTAMTSHQREVWGAGAAILRCMVDKMLTSRHHRLRLPWLWLVGVVSCAFNGQQRRLPALTTHFLLRASQLLSQPGHPMYQPVLNYLFLKPAFQVYLVPELYRLYNSAHITDNREHRSFLLSILSSGIRQILDYKISQRTFTSTLVIGMLQAPSADAELKVQALEVLEAMVHIPLGAVELVKNHSLLTILPLVVLGANFSDSSAATRSGHTLLMLSVVRVLSTLWATVLESTTRKDINSCDPTEEGSVELEDTYSLKRKITDETKKIPQKKIKLDSKSAETGFLDNDLESGEENKDKEIESIKSLNANASQQKLLPPLFVYEYLNTLMVLIPTIIASAPPTTAAKHLHLVAETVQYIGTVVEFSNKKHKLRLVALNTEVIKQQVYSRIQWDILYDQLQEYLSDDEEVKLLGDKAREQMKRWRSEPLSVHFQKRNSALGCEDRDGGIGELKEAVLKLLNVL